MEESLEDEIPDFGNQRPDQRNMECQDIIYSNDYVSYIIDYFLNIREIVETYQPDCFQYINKDYAILYQRIVGNMNLTLSQYGYHSIPKLYGLLDTSSMENIGVLRLRRQPYLDLTGRGVIIGIIDTGIDYRSSLFRYGDGRTRILNIWDQTIPGDKNEVNYFDFGSYYNAEDINRALESENPYDVVPSRDTNGHGTFMAGIAGGADLPQEEFTGVAPDCEFIIVKLKQAKDSLKEYYGVAPDREAYAEDDIMMGVRYVYWEAEQARKPLVICLGVGSNSGNHDGKLALPEYLSQNIRAGISVVCAAGNEGNRGHHYASKGLSADAIEEVELRIGQNAFGLSFELWAQAPNLFSMEFISPMGETTGKIPIWLQNNQTIRFPLEPTTINIEYTIVERRSGDEVVFVRMGSPTDGIWRLRVFNESGQMAGFNIWLPVEGLLEEDTYFLQSEPDTTICEPGNDATLITMAAFNHHNNSLYINSSRGYTSSGVVKPELVAPGVDVFGPAPSLRGENRYEQHTGSSIASAHCAGCAALMLEWGYVQGNLPTIQNMQIKNYLIRGARRMDRVVYPSKEWGYGELDIYRAFMNPV